MQELARLQAMAREDNAFSSALAPGAELEAAYQFTRRAAKTLRREGWALMRGADERSTILGAAVDRLIHRRTFEVVRILNGLNDPAPDRLPLSVVWEHEPRGQAEDVADVLERETGALIEPAERGAAAAREAPGIEGGRLVDPRAWWFAITAVYPVGAWQSAMLVLEPEFYRWGIGHQRDSSGAPRARLFLPHAGCRNCAPRNDAERRLGVRQDLPAAWDCYVDVVEHPGTAWVWYYRTPIEYVPLEPATPGAPPGEVPGVGVALGAELLAAFRELTDRAGTILRAIEAHDGTARELLAKLSDIQKNGVRVKLK